MHIIYFFKLFYNIYIWSEYIHFTHSFFWGLVFWVTRGKRRDKKKGRRLYQARKQTTTHDYWKQKEMGGAERNWI